MFRILIALLFLLILPSGVFAQDAPPQPTPALDPAQENGQIIGEIVYDTQQEVGQGIVAWGQTALDAVWDAEIAVHNGLIAVDNAITGAYEGYTGREAPGWYTAEPYYPAPIGCYYDANNYWVCP